MATFLFSLCSLFCFSANLLAGTTTDYDLKMHQPVGLKQFGGADVDLIVRSDDMGAVGVVTVDRTKMIPKARITSRDLRGNPDVAAIYYTANVVNVPTVTSKQVPKKDGLSDGASLSKLYAIYEDDALTVYYHNTPATPHNVVRLRIVRKPS